MTAPVVTVSASGTLADAVDRMVAHGIGSVVVAEDGNPVGIVTETDVLVAGHRSARPFHAIPISAAASQPLITVAPDATVRAAIDRMRAEGIKKLGVADGLELLGIVTQEDIVHGHPELVKEAIRLGERRVDWEGPGESP